MSDSRYDWLEGYTVIGSIQKPHGVKGECKVRPDTFDPSRFKKLDQAFLANPKTEQIQTLKIESSRFSGETLLIKFEEFSTPEVISENRFNLILVKETDRLPIDDGFYYSDLNNLVVKDLNDSIRGNILEVLEYPANEVIVIQTPSEKVLAPWIDDCVKEINLDAKFILIDFDFLGL